MLSIQPCNNVSFGYAPKSEEVPTIKASARAFTVAKEEAFKRINGESASVMESKILEKLGLTGRLPSTQGGVRFLGSDELTAFYNKVDSFTKSQSA